MLFSNDSNMLGNKNKLVNNPKIKQIDVRTPKATVPPNVENANMTKPKNKMTVV